MELPVTTVMETSLKSRSLTAQYLSVLVMVSFFFFSFFSLFLLTYKEDAVFPIWLICTFYMLSMFVVGFFFRWWWFLLFRVWHKFVGFSFKTRIKYWINYYLSWEKYGHFSSISTKALKEKKNSTCCSIVFT